MVTPFLFRPRPYSDETLESYLLRLTHANHASNYKDFSDIVAYNTELSGDIDERYQGSFNSLSSVNFYLEHQPKVKRITLLSYLAKMINLDLNLIVALGFHRSTVNTGIGHQLILLDDWLVPRCLFRKQGIPICIECLREDNYIRKLWHLLPYKHCHKHHLAMIENCTRCMCPLDYRESQSHHQCRCGFDLLSLGSQDSRDITFFDDVEQKKVADNLLSLQPYQKKLTLLVWYFYRFDSAIEKDFPGLTLNEFEQAENYFKHWPSNFIKELKERETYGEYFTDCKFSETAFSKVFGNIILNSRLSECLDKSEPLLTVLRSFVEQLIENHPPIKNANIADLLLSVEEIAILLNVDNKQICQAFEKGRLKPRYQLGANRPLEVYHPLFSLRQITNLPLG